MDNVLAILIAVSFVALWFWICRAVGLAAAKKGRSRGLWTVLSVMPLGPIIAPLWLKSLPVVGEKSSTGQLIGRTVLIGWLILSLVARIGSSIVTDEEKQVVAKAEQKYGHETEFVSKHYRKMSVKEIVECISLRKTAESMQYEADYDEANETWFFDTQDQADTYNELNAKYKEMECDARTYDISDLERAMKIIEGST